MPLNQTDNIFDEIKQVISLVDEMDKAGIRLNKNDHGIYTCFCPFHNGNTLSMYVNASQKSQTYHCFECQASGSVIDFVMRFKNMRLIEAVQYFKKNYRLKNEIELEKLNMLLNRRPETGAMKFDNDWTGVFIRGDNAGYYSMILSRLLKEVEEDVCIQPLDFVVLEDLVRTLANSNEFTSKEVQNLKKFNDCLI